MLLDDLAGLLRCEIVWGDDLLAATRIETCFAADLMSDVLASSRAGALLITGLTSVQSVHTAHLADLSAILFIGGKRPAEEVIDVARENRIPLLVTKRTMFEACAELGRAGLELKPEE